VKESLSRGTSESKRTLAHQVCEVKEGRGAPLSEDGAPTKPQRVDLNRVHGVSLVTKGRRDGTWWGKEINCSNRETESEASAVIEGLGRVKRLENPRAKSGRKHTKRARLKIEGGGGYLRARDGHTRQGM